MRTEPEMLRIVQAAFTFAMEELPRRKAELATLLAGDAAPSFFLGNVTRLLELEAVCQLRSLAKRTEENLAEYPGDFTEGLIEILSRGPDDGWSGRGNDNKRIMWDAQVAVVRKALGIH